MPVVLWTDALVFAVAAALVGYVLYASRHEHLAAPWRRVAHSASGVSAAVVLVFFVGAGLLDSLHFRPRIESGDRKSAAATVRRCLGEARRK